MAIVEEVPDQGSSSASAMGTTGRPRNPKQKSIPKDSSTIPLQHPSTIRSSDLKPLLESIPRPEGFPSLENIAYSDEDDDEEVGERDGHHGHVHHSHQPGSKVDEEAVERIKGDEVFDAVLITVPFVFLYILMDVLVHLQYNHRPKISELAERILRAIPTLGLIVFYTNRYPLHWATVSFLLSACILCGTRLIWLVNFASWSVVTAQAPAMGTLWILAIVQLPLSRCLLGLAVVAGWTWYTGMKVMP